MPRRAIKDFGVLCWESGHIAFTRKFSLKFGILKRSPATFADAAVFLIVGVQSDVFVTSSHFEVAKSVGTLLEVRNGQFVSV